MNKSLKIAETFVLLSVALAAGEAWAYETDTHARISFNAVANSSLAPGKPLLDQLGLTDTIYKFDPTASAPELNIAPFDTFYYDFVGSTVNPRPGDKYENRATLSEAHGVTDWVMRGAVREDDNPTELRINDVGTDRDIPQPFDREFNHFFDPTTNGALSAPAGIGLYYSLNGAGFAGIRTAPSWAAGVDDIFADPSTPGSVKLNHFTIPNAREAEFRALTGKASGSGTITPNGSRDTTVTIGVRNAYWATVFRSLGDLIHLSQDMAQPQHTRNEPHSGVGGSLVESLFTGHDSHYERYINARATGAATYTVERNSNTPTSNSSPLNYSGYAPPAFPDFASYWSTAVGQPGNSGKGLADYSNNNFFTFAHNFGDLRYASPPSSASNYVEEYLPDTSTPPASARYLTRYITDNYTGAPSDKVILQTADSGWKNLLPALRYNLDDYIYDDDASLLIPRAVGYSAGLLNYFFRGSLEITPPAIGVYGVIDDAVENDIHSGGFKKIKLRVRNTTPAQTGWGQQDMSGGTLTAVLKFHRNNATNAHLDNEWTGYPPPNERTPDEEIITSNTDLTGNPITGVSLPTSSDSVEYGFDFSANPLPINATDVYLQVVYRGKLGTEQNAVVVGTINISEPTHAAAYNTSKNTACVNGGWMNLNADGSVTAAIKAALPSGWQIIGPQTLPTVQFAFQQSETAPFDPPTGSFNLPLKFPLTDSGPVQPGEYVSISTLTDVTTTYDWYVPTYAESYDVSTWEGQQFQLDFIYQNNVVSPKLEYDDIEDVLGTRTWAAHYAYVAYGSGNCQTIDDPAIPTLTAADGGNYPAPKLIPTTLNF